MRILQLAVQPPEVGFYLLFAAYLVHIVLEIFLRQDEKPY
jgi:hypothetical protein